MGERCLRVALSESEPKANRSPFRDLATALCTNAGWLGSRIFVDTRGAVITRGQEEEAHAARIFSLEIWRAADFAPYAEFLESTGDPGGATRIRKLMARLPESGFSTQWGYVSGVAHPSHSQDVSGR
jgi:hypothetical protein